VKRGAFPTCFDAPGRGVIPVAIFGSATLNVNDIDADSLILEGLIVKMSGKRSTYLAHAGYVKEDQSLDLIVQFENSYEWRPPGNGCVKLQGSFYDGTSFWQGIRSASFHQETNNGK